VDRSPQRIAPSQGFLLDNISNTLQVARDAVVGKRMFLFLGLPGALLAAFLASYAGVILAITQCRELATLRVRGAHRGHPLRKLAYGTLLLASTGSLLGIALGFLSALLFLTPRQLFGAPAFGLVESALVAADISVLTTALALYVPGRRSLSREVNTERPEISTASVTLWRRLRLDVALLMLAAIAEAIAYGTGAFDPPVSSVSAGEAVEFPLRLLLAPLIAWLGGTLLFVRIFAAIASRVQLPAPPQLGPLVRGTLKRSLRRRAWTIAMGVVGLGLVVAFGISLALFSAAYKDAKAADARFVVGSRPSGTLSISKHRQRPWTRISEV
jgi:putative ABC transport system permease protein